VKLWNGLKVIVWKMKCDENTYAGGYDVHNIEMLSSKATIKMSVGQPFDSAFKEAELLATVIDAEFVLKEGITEIILRKSIKGEYYNPEDKTK